MEVMATRPVEAITPITRRTDAREVALAAYDRLLTLLGSLPDEAWETPTECEPWDVSAMVGHLIGAARSNASLRELARQQRIGMRRAAGHDGNALDAVNDLQVREQAELSTSERIDTLRALVPAAVRGRLRLPGALRRVTVPLDAGGSTAPGMPGRLSLGHLNDVVYSRDVWLHTIDIARATGARYEPVAEVDGRIVADVVREWAARHDEPFTLQLTGPAGGSFRQGHGGPTLQLDAVGFCRVLSGRVRLDTESGRAATATVGETSSEAGRLGDVELTQVAAAPTASGSAASGSAASGHQLLAVRVVF